MVASGEAVRGLSIEPVAALRYDGSSADAFENTGLLLSMIPEGSRVLDVGCGTGAITTLIRDLRRADVVGIEPHPDRARRASERGLNVLCGIYSDDVPKKLGTFDAILFADVLEHLVDPIELLEKVKPALSPGGIILASIPNVAHWSIRLRLLAGKFEYKSTGIMDATHLRWFTRSGVERLFDEAGYKIEAFHAAAGGWMGEYYWTPLRWLSYEKRSYVLSKLCGVAPGLFGVQHVVAARLRATQ